MSRLSNWLDNPNDTECPHCGNNTRIVAGGGDFVNICCDDYDCDGYPGRFCEFNWEDMNNSTELIILYLPDDWVIGETEPVVYTCPECSGENIERTPYDDGLGYYDVKLECMDCGEEIWE